MTLLLLLRPHRYGLVVFVTDRLTFAPTIVAFDDPNPLARPRSTT